MATVSPQEIEEIRRKMALIRHDLHQDVRGVVEGAEAATDWRRYIKSYPWAGVGVAFAIGYLIVPRRHANASTTIHVAPAVAAAPQAIAAAIPAEIKKERKSLIRMAFGLAIPLVIKAGRGYALQYAEQWLAQRMAQHEGGSGGIDKLIEMLGAGGPPGASQAPGQPPRAPAQPTPGRPPSGPRF